MFYDLTRLFILGSAQTASCLACRFVLGSAQTRQRLRLWKLPGNKFPGPRKMPFKAFSAIRFF